MKKHLFLVVALLTSGSVFAGTDHYLLRDGSHVHHLKINTTGNTTTVSTDVDFEPSTSEAGKHACSAQFASEAKKTAENILVAKKHIEGEAKSCTLTIHLSPNGATIEQSEECGYFAAGICHFNSDGKELVKIQ